MRVATLAIGDELLDGRSTERHGAWLSTELEALGCEHVEHRVLGDELELIAHAISDMTERAELLICTGGLGPTPDDLSREALAHALKEELIQDADARAALEARFASTGRTVGPGNLRQVFRPQSCTCIVNHEGTAPGIDGKFHDARVVLLPGPPHEMKAMFSDAVVPLLASAGAAKTRASVQAYGLAESRAAELISEHANREKTPLVAFKVADSVVRADLLGERSEEVATEIERAWHPFAFGRGETSLPSAVGSILAERQATVVTAESCTGGLLGGALSSVPGSSAFFRGGLTTYANEFKTALLGVPEGLLKDSGAVSEQVAVVMALEAARRLGASYALSTTGIAGPDGGTEEKPVGTVWVGVCDASGAHPIAFARLFQFPGDRNRVRDRTVKSALQLLRLHLLGEETPLLWEHTA